VKDAARWWSSMSLAIAGVATTLALSEVPVQAQEPPQAPAAEHKAGSGA
jgi:hypothetical protein